MSVLDSVLSNTAGFVWRGATGTVDPWTKNNLVETETNNILTAQGIDPSMATPEQLSAARTQAMNDATTTLTSYTGPDGKVGADPSQASTGLSNSLKKFESYIVWIVILIIAVYLLGKYLEKKG